MEAMNNLPTCSSKDFILRAVCLHNSSYIHKSDKHITQGQGKQGRSEASDVGGGGGGGRRILPEILTSMLKIYLKCNLYNVIIIKLFVTDFHCHTTFREKRGLGFLPQKSFTFLKL